VVQMVGEYEFKFEIRDAEHGCLYRVHIRPSLVQPRTVQTLLGSGGREWTQLVAY
jgi:hypothetical protein